MKKKVTGAITVLFLAMCATGCGNAIPEISEQEQELIVEYTVGKVLKYDKMHVGKLTELKQEETEEMLEDEDVQQDNVPDEVGDEAVKPETEADNVPVIDNTEGILTNVTIEEFLKLDSVKITYNGFEVAGSYPEQSEELHFAMDATNGNQLLIVKFLTENISGTDVSLDIAQSNTRFKLVVNGEEKNALTTLLLNDLAYYQGTLAPGESTELVLVCEVPSEQAGEITTLGLTMKNDDTASIILN